MENFKERQQESIKYNIAMNKLLQEESHYFIPDIEDIRVGYEGEYHNWCIDERGDPKFNFNRWEKAILTEGNVRTMLEYGIKSFRVPYLTKEQIEAEGWELKHKSIDLWFEAGIDKASTLQGFYQYKAYGLFLNYGLHDHKLKIKADFNASHYFDDADTLFEGECKDINTFRYICKLLKIK